MILALTQLNYTLYLAILSMAVSVVCFCASMIVAIYVFCSPRKGDRR